MAQSQMCEVQGEMLGPALGSQQRRSLLLAWGRVFGSCLGEQDLGEMVKSS